MTAQTTPAPMSMGRFWASYVLLAAGPFLVLAAPRTLTAAAAALAAGALIIVLTLPLYLFGDAAAGKARRQRNVMLASFSAACLLGLANLAWRIHF